MLSFHCVGKTMWHHRQALWSLFNPRSTGDVDTGLLRGVLGSSWVSIGSGHFEQQSSTLLWQTKMHRWENDCGRSRLPWELRGECHVSELNAETSPSSNRGCKYCAQCIARTSQISRFLTNAKNLPGPRFFSDGHGFSQILCGQDLGGHAGERDSL